MASLSGAFASGNLTLTGAGFSGTEALIAISFTATNGRRSTLETIKVPVVAGAISYVFTPPFTVGSISAKAVDSAGATIVSATSVAV